MAPSMTNKGTSIVNYKQVAASKVTLVGFAIDEFQAADTSLQLTSILHDAIFATLSLNMGDNVSVTIGPATTSCDIEVNFVVVSAKSQSSPLQDDGTLSQIELAMKTGIDIQLPGSSFCGESVDSKLAVPGEDGLIRLDVDNTQSGTNRQIAISTFAPVEPLVMTQYTSKLSGSDISVDTFTGMLMGLHPGSNITVGSVQVSAKLNLTMLGVHISDLSDEIQRAFSAGVASILGLDQGAVSVSGKAAIVLTDDIDNLVANGSHREYRVRRQLNSNDSPSCGSFSLFATDPTQNTTVSASDVDHSQLSFGVQGTADTRALLAAGDFIQNLIQEMISNPIMDSVQQVDLGPRSCTSDMAVSTTVNVATPVSPTTLSTGADAVVMMLANTTVTDGSVISIADISQVLQVSVSDIGVTLTSGVLKNSMMINQTELGSSIGIEGSKLSVPASMRPMYEAHDLNVKSIATQSDVVSSGPMASSTTLHSSNLADAIGIPGHLITQTGVIAALRFTSAVQGASERIA